MPIISCQNCRKKVAVRPYRARTARFCSYGCNASYRFKGIKKLPMSAETKFKISTNNRRSMLGKKRPDLQTIEARRRMSNLKMGQPAWNKGMKGYMAGPCHHWRGINRSGPNNPVYISDRSKLKKSNDANKDRRSSAYQAWRKEVWKRDGFKCRISGTDCSGRIEAHHILGYTEYPELRYEINNGITLCRSHHPKKRADERLLSPFFQQIISNLT